MWGNKHVEQIPPTNQGIVHIHNDGTISNAICAVNTIKMDASGPLHDFAGGIIFAKEAHFINNNVDVEFWEYTYNNISYFEHCYFITNVESLLSCQPDYHLKLKSVREIEIKGCNFENSWPFSRCDLTLRGSGIYSFDSKFFVDHLCISEVQPCDNYLSTSFKKLSYGIYNLDMGYNRLVTVRNSDFMENYRGLYASGCSNNLEVTSNDFQICTELTDNSIYGMYLDRCTGYHIEDNDFYSMGTSPHNIGLYVNNSGTDDNMVYNNFFDNLYFAMIAQDINRDDDQGGLCIKCNDFSNTGYDISVTSSSPYSSPDHGIAKYQGTMAPLPDAPAGNTFSDQTTHEWDIYNEANSIDYVFHNRNTTPLKVYPSLRSGNVLAFENTFSYYDKPASCPSMLDYGGGDPETMKSTMASIEQNIQSISDTLSLLVDGGDTDDMNMDVIMSYPDEAMQLRQQLLDESPYLSDTVMKSAIYKENVLPNAMIRDVLVENPQAAKSESVLQSIDDRFDPMPDYMMEEILEGKDSVGNKEVLQSKLAAYQQNRFKAFNTLNKLYKIDTNSLWGRDSLVLMLENEESLSSQYELLFLFQEDADSIKANSVLDSIPIKFALSALQLTEYSNYGLLFDILFDIKGDSLTVLELDSLQLLSLQSCMLDNGLLPSVYSKNILFVNELTSYIEQIILPDPFKSAIVEEELFKDFELPNKESRMSVYPNPAGQYVIIEYHLEEPFTNAYIEILDISSILKYSEKLSGTHNQKVISLEDFITGNYFIRLVLDNKILESKKVTILR